MIIFLGITHICISIVICSILFRLNFLEYVLVILGSLFPDIDTSFSYIGRQIKFLSCFLKHRGIVHTIIGLFIFSIIVFILFDKFWLAFSLGYLLHLLADTLTPMGIMWKYPLSKKYYSLSNKNINYRNYEYVIIIFCLMYIFEKWIY